MKQFNYLKGQVGEKAAEEFLRKKGYQILERNFYTKFGEIDIIAKEKRKGATLPKTVFVEVKTKSGEEFGEPWEMVDERKIGRVRRMAELYLMKKRLGEVACRIDVVGVWLDIEGEVEKIEHWENVGGG
ncbi:YraN family protein [Patescibacteria group bacterium]|nr:YraN family protein [Patescibacteria group bacterium]MBU1500404.1 YraN family protein [Patescibacteria group bacterium]